MQHHQTAILVLSLATLLNGVPVIVDQKPPSEDSEMPLTSDSDTDFPVMFDPPSEEMVPDFHSDLPYAFDSPSEETPVVSDSADTDFPSIHDSPSSSDSELPTAHAESPMEDPNLFEGDMTISQEMIDQYYEAEESTDGKRTRRAAARNRNILWANKTIPITFSNTTDVNTRFLIAKAIKEIEHETCLKFSLRTDEEDYIEFTGDGSGCASYVGRRGGKQTITLPEFDYGTCRTHGIIIHETCHALGMWHEQSRPDRDLYVAVLEDNIKAGKEHNFRRRSTLDVDYRGEAYDYGSIMHYRLSSFSSSGSPTLKVTNTTEYNHQGKPTIGQRKGLSKSDIIQLNRMYNCQGSGLRGNLEVYIKNGFNVPGRSSYADRYVKIAAVDDRGVKETLTTRYIYGSYYLLWNQWLDFGRRSWQYIEVSLWDNRFLGPDAEHDRLTETQTFSINPGYHSNIQHCNDKNCSIKLAFDYNLIQESDARTQCDPNPCLHGGTCWQFTLSKSYECSCPENYSGPHCEFITGNLLVYAYRGYNLLNSDGKYNKSDPYLYLVAHDKDGNSKHIRSTSVTDNDNPRWYQLLYFGYGHWKTFDVSIWDEDEGADDSLSDVSTYHLPSYYTSRSYVKKSGYNGGYVYFNYHFRQS